MGTSDRSFAWAQRRRSARESRAATGAAVHRIGGSAGGWSSNTTIVRDDLEVNAKSIMGVMMLAAECGATVLLRALGDDAQEAIDALAAVIANKFGES